MANETREQALSDLEVELERLPVRDLALLTGEALFVRGLATDLGATVEELGRRLWASELTEARAAALIKAAGQTVLDRFMKAEAEKERRKPRPAGRRR